MEITGTGLNEHEGSGTFTFPMEKLSNVGSKQGYGEFEFPVEQLIGYGESTRATGIYRGVAINLTNQAISTYSNYPFNSLAYFNGKYYGATSTGLYILGKGHDNGRQILSKIKTGPMDFGTKATKYIRDVWLTYRSDGHVSVTFSVDESNEEEVERITQLASNELREEKLKVARGLKGRYWTLEFRNKSGADFDVDKWEILVDILSGKKR